MRQPWWTVFAFLLLVGALAWGRPASAHGVVPAVATPAPVFDVVSISEGCTGGCTAPPKYVSGDAAWAAQSQVTRVCALGVADCVNNANSGAYHYDNITCAAASGYPASSYGSVSCSGTLTYPGGTSTNYVAAYWHSGSVSTACPANSTANGAGGCLCDSGFKANGSSCQPYSCTAKVIGATNVGPYSSSDTFKDGNYCDTSGENIGCQVAFERQAAFQAAEGWWITVSERWTGQTCQGTGTSTGDNGSPTDGVPKDLPDDAPPPPATQCPVGKVPGTVNGETVCVDPGTASDTSTTTNQNGSGQTTSTTSSTTTCSGGMCTTKTTTQDGNGTVTGTSTTTGTQEAFCKNNAGSLACAAAVPASGPGAGTGNGSGSGDNPGTAVDSTLPGVPNSLYTRKYPDGVAGVWSAKQSQLSQTPMAQFVGQVMPTSLGGGGTCPQYTFPSGTVLGITVGGDLSVPCSVWAFIKIVITISALLLARALIFGG